MPISGYSCLGFVPPACHRFMSSSTPASLLPSTLVESTTSTPSSSSTMLYASLSSRIQQVGENFFVALLLIATIQGAVAIHQYRTNPAGELVVPPGRTLGVEDFSTTGDEQENTLHHPKKTIAGRARELVERELSQDSSQQIVAKASHMKKGWYYLSKYLVILTPWLARQWSFVLVRYGHLLHIGLIMGLASMLDYRPSTPESKRTSPLRRGPKKVVVIGDSLACGIGCVNVYDETKNTTVPIQRIETIDSQTRGNGPIFPRSLARTLSKEWKTPVSWRSAGVDGGDVNDIRQHCVGILREEVDRDGVAPDVVVVLCGVNDMKNLLTSSQRFPDKLKALIGDIRKICPSTIICFPALPTYRLDSNSLLNVFPLSFFLDVMMGFWDWQKKRVADSNENVVYCGLSAMDVYDWYMIPDNDDEETTLIAADGLHPNGKCYHLWATLVGNTLAEITRKNDALAVKKKE